MKKSKEYLKEVKKDNILDNLKSIKKRLKTLVKVYSKRKKMDNETKQNIIILHDISTEIFNTEMDKELKKQKKEGKEFLSDDDVDNLIESVKTEIKTEEDDTISMTWKDLANILDHSAYKLFKEYIGEEEPKYGFRELFPVIENKEMLMNYILKLIKLEEKEKIFFKQKK